MTRYTGIATLLFLIVAGVPWYWRFFPQSGNELWFRVPAWFVVSVAASIAVSVLTAIQFLIPWPDEIGKASDSRTSDDAGGSEV